MISLYDSNIVDILPEHFKTQPEAQALSYALSRGMKRLIEYCQHIGIYASIDIAPHEVLDILALELNTQYYDDTLDIEAKRKLIKNTLIWYMSSGTPAAVEELVAAVFGEGEVKEWFEYTDDPYYFKILTNAIMTPNMDLTFSTMLRRVKNTRSHIRAIEIHRTVEQELMSGVAQHSNVRPAAIIDGYKVDHEAEQTLFAGILEHAQTCPEPILDGFSIVGEEVQGYTYFGTAVTATTKQGAIREELVLVAEAAKQTLYGGVAESVSIQKPAAITEGLTEIAEPVTQAIAVGVAADNSRYKNTITE